MIKEICDSRGYMRLTLFLQSYGSSFIKDKTKRSLCVQECFIFLAATAKLLQSCPTLCDPIDGSLPGSPVPGILQARTLEWAAISFSNAGKWKIKVKSLSRVWLFATPWTAAYQAPLPMGFSRQDYWSGVPLPSLNNTDGVSKTHGSNMLGQICTLTAQIRS